MAPGKFTPNFNTLFSALALMISILALVVSFYEASILESQQRAMVWPYLSVTVSYNSERFSVEAANNGIGPAIVNSMQVRYQGQVYTNWHDLLARIYPDRTFGWDIMQVNELNGRVVMAGETVTVFSLPWGEGVQEVARQIQNEVEASICYCSVMDECWELQMGEQESRTQLEKSLAYDREFEQ